MSKTFYDLREALHCFVNFHEADNRNEDETILLAKTIQALGKNLDTLSVNDVVRLIKNQEAAQEENALRVRVEREA
jgi:hypothetical protein